MNLNNYRGPTLRKLVRYAEAHGLSDIDAVAHHLHTEYKHVVSHAAQAVRLADRTVRRLWDELELPHARRVHSGKPAELILPNGMNLSEYALSCGHPAGGAFYQRTRRHFHKTGNLLTAA